ncbi:ABC transporter substrate-binding protein [Oscillatoria sp. FACHB-1407]|uniref:ABC transporter substrate-binding protein n=1 Tax=Oscillatoria sp. FACHB-1407 TaxID=2692847 RepID=UPI00168604CB|nr:ABC transporter substrate-binding protein [Oscillatoria sp. FACHB-1407]MBD2459805.1 ABC transporter substrate-binding protein [Oscillatoria sp. FACHB-1407]
MGIRRRTLLQVGAGAVLATAAHACVQPSSTQAPQTESTAASGSSSENPGKISIGFWPIASGLPLYLGVEKGYFKEAGLDVEAVKFASAQQVAEGIIAGRLQGSGNGTASGALALAEIASPGLFKIFASNPSNVDYVLEQFIVAKDSPIQSIADLQGKKVASGPGAQNKAIAEAVLEKNGITGVQVMQLEIKQHVAAIEAGQIDAAYTLEPTGTVGSMKGITRILENGVVAKYILDDPKAPWFGGSATLSTQFINAYPETAKVYAEAYRKAIEDIRNDPDEARQYLVGYTAIEGDLVQKVPLAAYTMYDEFTPEDVGYFQKFFDFMTDKGVFSRTVEVEPLLYKPA